MDKLLELAERCERATGPDRELDAEIAIVACGWAEILSEEGDWRSYRSLDGSRVNVMRGGQNGGYATPSGLPFFTSSIDAALTLVPEGFAWVVYWDGYAGVEKITGDDLPQVDQQSATPALALCAAALRARATQGSASDG